MSLFETSLAELTERLLRVPLQDWRGGTVTGSTSTTVFADSVRGEADDYFQNTTPQSSLVILSTTANAAPIGQVRLITDFANSGGAFATVAFTVAPPVGATYAILSEYSWDEIVSAINTAIDIATGKGARYEHIDESMLIEGDVFEYPVPEGFSDIYRITQADGDGLFQEAIPWDSWTIMRGGAIPKIVFKTYPDEGAPSDHYFGELWAETLLSDGKALRIEGLAKQPKLAHPQDLCFLNPNFVVYQAAALLHGARIVQTESDFSGQKTRAAYCQSVAEGFILDTIKTLPANTKRVQR